MIGKTNDVVRKELMINASQRRAFQAFTEQMDLWWPRSHHIGKSEMKEAVLETKQGGRWYEVGVDGTECNWGKVLVWNPPHKLVLAWQITAEWQYDPNFLTEVEVNFSEKGPKIRASPLSIGILKSLASRLKKSGARSTPRVVGRACSRASRQSLKPRQRPE